ncbi:hypothetical protein PRZ48_000951 [Zasmidium cellare]|uniref:F-box domain-containing protein n=1 Tax=Zasmidium cellare TaxID=395010 RepID=A0ABR0F1J2_ZASCE|nr:hypothetical protein PRZ48_000951 [Zasmidium cellare]
MSSSVRIHYLEEVSRDLSAISRDNGIRVPFDDVRAFVAAAQHLKDTIRALHQPSADTRLESDHIQNELARAKDSADQICGFFNSCWDQVPVAHRPSAQSAIVAQKVFALPELLELILADLDLYDALRAQQVSRVWRDGINSSVKMQRAMGLRTDDGADFFTPLSHDHESSPWDRTFPGVCFEQMRGAFDPFNATQEGNVVRSLAVGIHVSTSTPLSVGARCRRILICQPPLKRATVRVDHYCIHHRCSPIMFEYEIASDDGIRVRDVLDAAQEAFDGYCCCGWYVDRIQLSDTDSHDGYGPGGAAEGVFGDTSSGIEDEGERGEAGKGDEGGNSEGDTDADRANLPGSDLSSFTHHGCEVTITVRGVVTLKDDDPLVVDRRRRVAAVDEYRQRSAGFS